MIALEAMSVTQSLRDRVNARIEAGETLYRIAKDSGVDWTTLKRFVDGGGLRAEHIDTLADYFKLGLLPLADESDEVPPTKPAKKPPRQ